MEVIVTLCPYCRLVHYTTRGTERFQCSRCHSIIPVQAYEVQNYSSNVTTKTWKDSPLQKIRSPSPSSGYKAFPHESPKTAFSLFNACPRGTYGANAGKRALICGVTYKKQKYKLKGTLTDVYNIKDLLMNQYHFPANAIRVLTEENDPHRAPTKENMEEGLRWLVKGCRPGDSLVFYFSGHGLRQPDFDNDEVDGFDETLCPVDFKTKGLILDNDINAMIVRPLPKGVTLHAIIDACYSGTILDLEHLYSLKERRWLDNRPPSGANKCTSGGRAICFSACRDDQMATDTSAFSQKGMSGVMTHCFIQAVLKKPRLTYFELLSSVQENIMKTFESRCLSSKLMDKLLHRKLSQACFSFFRSHITS
ncbi:hypothetical protein Cgig2_001852 [Carnegiea gigantea]|uniref:Peptidase C14 caspase domain-containing protein n=1 Tax=Carnegiea gigantea TaxID=171969 RepID=A0A9Q1JZW6_9CARY|nr:hypothetical protein Cgig2_001852 [Carnegiea gigantea]